MDRDKTVSVPPWDGARHFTCGDRRLEVKGRWPRRLALVSMVVICGAIFTATPAMAHAELLIATPSPGVGISQAPGAAVLKFSEPLNRNLSRIHVFDQSGRDVAKGATLTVEGDAQAMERKLGLMRLNHPCWPTGTGLRVGGRADPCLAGVRNRTHGDADPASTPSSGQLSHL